MSSHENPFSTAFYGALIGFFYTVASNHFQTKYNLNTNFAPKVEAFEVNAEACRLFEELSVHSHFNKEEFEEAVAHADAFFLILKRLRKEGTKVTELDRPEAAGYMELTEQCLLKFRNSITDASKAEELAHIEKLREKIGKSMEKNFQEIYQLTRYFKYPYQGFASSAPDQKEQKEQKK